MPVTRRGTPSRARSKSPAARSLKPSPNVRKSSSSPRTKSARKKAAVKDESDSSSQDDDSDSSLPDITDVNAILDEVEETIAAVEKTLAEGKRPRFTMDVFFYVPQFVGYFRIVCTMVSIYYAIVAQDTGGTYHKRAIVGYALSFAGDLVDGMAARKFDQSSHFGGVLDMVTDRCTTAGFIVVLTWLYTEPAVRFMLISILMLDVASHWMSMYSALKIGAHHKSNENQKRQFFLVRWYYTSYPFFACCCVGAELTYMVAFAMKFNPIGVFFYPFTHLQAFWIFAPFCAVKNLVNLVQLASAAWTIAEADKEEWNLKNVEGYELGEQDAN